MTASRPPLPGSYEGLLNQARQAFQGGDLLTASTHYRHLVDRLRLLSEQILARRPELRDMTRQASIELAEALSLQGRYAEAVETLEALVASHPEQSAVWRRNAAVLRVAKGEVDRGLAELKALTDETPDGIANWLVLGDEARIEGRFAVSQAALDRAIALAGKSKDKKLLADAHYRRFRLFEGMGRVDDAIASWEQAVSSHADVAATVREVYTLLTRVGRYGEAERYIDRDKNELQAGFQRGLVAELTGNPAKARGYWQQVAQLDPVDYEAGHDGWVEAVLRLGDPEPALQGLQQILSKHATDRLLVLTGIAWAMYKDGEMAARFFQQAVNILRFGHPPKQKLDGADWHLLDTLVAEGEIKAALKSYFAVIESVWGDTSLGQTPLRPLGSEAGAVSRALEG